MHMFVDEEHIDWYGGDGWTIKEEREEERVVSVTKQQIETFNGEILVLRNHKKVERESGRRGSLVASSICLSRHW